MIKKLRENKAITLIALVITIIVLLILAGVAISMLSGENGILNQAAKAKTETEKKSTEEAVKLATISAMTNTNHSVDQTELEKELKNSLGSNYTIDGNETDGWTVEAGGETYLVTKDGDVMGKDEIPVQSISVDDYGALVTNYTLNKIETDVKWKIFLDDGENIYLIADNYIEGNNIPQSKGGNSLDNNQEGHTYQRTGWVNYNVLNDYKGSSDIVQNTKLSKKYNKWAYAYSTADYNGIKTIAYMLDTSENVWGKYVNSDYAEYAIGGPTLEMFCESYKKTHPDKYIQYDEHNDYGYKVKWSDEESYKSGVSILDKNAYQELYFGGSHAPAMWIASLDNATDRPEGHGDKGDFVYGISNGGRLDSLRFNEYGSGGSGAGFRPVICLKSGIYLKKIKAEQYEIVTGK